MGLLNKWGHEVDVAVDGQEAIDALEDGEYDVILMDVHMPEMNGFEATADIQSFGFQTLLTVQEEFPAIRTVYLYGDKVTTELTAEVPLLDPPPVLTMADMGMAMDHAGEPGAIDHATMDHTTMDHGAAAPAVGDPAASTRDPNLVHDRSANGRSSQLDARVGVDMQAVDPQPRLDDPGVGLRHRSWRVLTYGALRTLRSETRVPDVAREIELHLTGNMARYMWSFDGIRAAEAAPIRLGLGEHVRAVAPQRVEEVAPGRQRLPRECKGGGIAAWEGRRCGIPALRSEGVPDFQLQLNAQLVQASGEDWNDVTISVSTSLPDSQIARPRLAPQR